MSATEAFKTEIYEQYHGKVLGYFWSKLNNRQIAEDLCSEVFLKIYEKIDDYDAHKASVSTWIFTIARNRLTDYFRTRHVLFEISENLEDNSSIEEEICNRETLEMLAAALEALDERQRDIIIFRYYKGYTLKEIAGILQISYAYVKILHKKALSALRKNFPA